MELTTFQHILEHRGLEGIAQRACQHHADKWTSLFRTGDHETEFEELIGLAIKVQTMRKMFADGDVYFRGPPPPGAMVQLRLTIESRGGCVSLATASLANANAFFPLS